MHHAHGSGILNINDNNIQNFTQMLIEKSSKTQLQMLKKAIKILKVGSEMVYSTCSILDVENENIISKILEIGNIEIVPIKIKGQEEIPLLPTKIEGTLCIMPTSLYEGFFVAKIRKIR